MGFDNRGMLLHLALNQRHTAEHYSMVF